ncbi:hypothetical protein NQ317_009563 [Molorchus minor]|uniref:DUF4806 domain-containing protein n=1 Tax=Molorchus minor TaxID=1323400 RepID=A0ABQ9JIK7_9CUCU|nr:hypothetical protein NQ317_009563 [Molorchus minor]
MPREFSNLSERQRRHYQVLSNYQMKIITQSVLLTVLLKSLTTSTKLVYKNQNPLNLLIRHLKALGGRDGRDHLFRSLASVFTNQLATQCSWHGQRGNFELNNLSFMKLITDIVACQYVNTITISDTEIFLF